MDQETRIAPKLDTYKAKQQDIIRISGTHQVSTNHTTSREHVEFIVATEEVKEALSEERITLPIVEEEAVSQQQNSNAEMLFTQFQHLRHMESAKRSVQDNFQPILHARQTLQLQKQTMESQQSYIQQQQSLFVKLFNEMNEKAIESMSSARDEPEVALEYLKKVIDTMEKIETSIYQQEQMAQKGKRVGGTGKDACRSSINMSQSFDVAQAQQQKAIQVSNIIDPNYKTTLYYNVATCYQRLGMLEECVDYLELSTASLNQKIQMLEEEENALLFQTTDHTSFHDEHNLYQKTEPHHLITQPTPISHTGTGTMSASSKGTTFITQKQGAQSQTPLTQTSNPNKVQANRRDRLLGLKLQKLRYQCKLHLQLCAILSQLGQHSEALSYAQRAVHSAQQAQSGAGTAQNMNNCCVKLLTQSQLLCKRLLRQVGKTIHEKQQSDPNETIIEASIEHSASNQHEALINHYHESQLSQASGSSLSGYLSTQRHKGLHGGKKQTISAKVPGSRKYNHLLPSSGGRSSMQSTERKFDFDTLLKGYLGTKQNIISSSGLSQKRSQSSQNIADGNIVASNHSSNGKRSESGVELRQALKINASGTRVKIHQKSSILSRDSSRASSFKDSTINPPKVGDDTNGDTQQRALRDNSNESLERIHTFALKSSFQERPGGNLKVSTYYKEGGNQDTKIQDSPPAKSQRTDKPQDALIDMNFKMVQQKLKADYTANSSEGEEEIIVYKATSNQQKPQQHKNSTINKTYYVEEQVTILQGIIMQADPILNEIVSKVKQFERFIRQRYYGGSSQTNHSSGNNNHSNNLHKDDSTPSSLMLHFQSEHEIDQLVNSLDSKRFKINVRNALGVRHHFFSKGQDSGAAGTSGGGDWIYNLNIGNVMHLSLMGAEEINDNSQNAKSLEQTTHELGKDSMLEKIVLVSVAYFCIATEMRFLMNKQQQQQQNNINQRNGSKSHNQQYSKHDSEAFHAQALQISSLFLPSECPLVAHIIRSYKRNYLKDKKTNGIQLSAHRTGEQQIQEVRAPITVTSSFPGEENPQQVSRQSYGGVVSNTLHGYLGGAISRSNDEILPQQNTTTSLRLGRGKHQQPSQISQQQAHQLTHQHYLTQQVQPPRATTSASENSSKDEEQNSSSSGGGGTGSSMSQPNSLDAKPNRIMASHISEKPVSHTNNNSTIQQETTHNYQQNSNLTQNITSPGIETLRIRPAANSRLLEEVKEPIFSEGIDGQYQPSQKKVQLNVQSNISNSILSKLTASNTSRQVNRVVSQDPHDPVAHNIKLQYQRYYDQHLPQASSPNPIGPSLAPKMQSLNRPPKIKSHNICDVIIDQQQPPPTTVISLQTMNKTPTASLYLDPSKQKNNSGNQSSKAQYGIPSISSSRVGNVVGTGNGINHGLKSSVSTLSGGVMGLPPSSSVVKNSKQYSTINSQKASRRKQI